MPLRYPEAGLQTGVSWAYGTTHSHGWDWAHHAGRVVRRGRRRLRGGGAGVRRAAGARLHRHRPGRAGEGHARPCPSTGRRHGDPAPPNCRRLADKRRPPRSPSSPRFRGASPRTGLGCAGGAGSGTPGRCSTPCRSSRPPSAWSGSTRSPRRSRSRRSRTRGSSPSCTRSGAPARSGRRGLETRPPRRWRRACWATCSAMTSATSSATPGSPSSGAAWASGSSAKAEPCWWLPAAAACTASAWAQPSRSSRRPTASRTCCSRCDRTRWASRPSRTTRSRAPHGASAAGCPRRCAPPWTRRAPQLREHRAVPGAQRCLWMGSLAAVAFDVVIAGGGFGGLYAARRLERRLPRHSARITVVSDLNFLLYTPLLPGAAAGTLEPRHVVVPIREELEWAELELGRVTGADPAVNEVYVRTLDERAIGFKTLADAIGVRNRALLNLEIAESLPDDASRREYLTFVFVGAGYAGVEGIAELQDYVSDILDDYPRCRAVGTRWVLVEALDQIMPEVSKGLAEFATRELRGRGLHNVWAIGDAAAVPDPAKRRQQPTPPTCQHAIRQGRVVGENVAASLVGRKTRPFRYRTLGVFVDMGRNKAVASILGIPLRGFPAWFAARTYHLAMMPGFARRVRLGADWAVGLLFGRASAELGQLGHPPALRDYLDEEATPPAEDPGQRTADA